MTSQKTLLEDIFEALISQLPEYEPEERRIAARLLRMLCCGRPVSIWRLASRLYAPVSLIEPLLKKWPGVQFDDENRVEGFGGLTTQTTAHDLFFRGTHLHTTCAWDGLFLPRILGDEAEIRSHCPVTGDRIRIRVEPDNFEVLESPEAVMSFVTPEAAHDRENILLHLCEFVHFFSSLPAAEIWLANHPGALILSLDEAFQLGRWKVVRQLGTELVALPT